ncbi:hypothetical protein EVAR_4074_1 [Eumeta japonica]|uniref:Uncharacterized protein n=1 Tax=Eumeta variegata TaxID=151549 RepID=A0A4C1T524_EUMVA|nr:hypothetical protein EVAR_4074_1 [Eumeta japonica]
MEYRRVLREHVPVSPRAPAAVVARGSLPGATLRRAAVSVKLARRTFFIYFVLPISLGTDPRGGARDLCFKNLRDETCSRAGLAASLTSSRTHRDKSATDAELLARQLCIPFYTVASLAPFTIVLPNSKGVKLEPRHIDSLPTNKKLTTNRPSEPNATVSCARSPTALDFFVLRCAKRTRETSFEIS